MREGFLDRLQGSLRRATGVRVVEPSASERPGVNAEPARVERADFVDQMKREGRLDEVSSPVEFGGGIRRISRATLTGEEHGHTASFCNDRSAVQRVVRHDNRPVIQMLVEDGVDSTGKRGGELAQAIIDHCFAPYGFGLYLQEVKEAAKRFIANKGDDFTGCALTGLTIDASGRIKEGIQGGDTIGYLLKKGRIYRLTFIQNEAGIRAEEIMEEQGIRQTEVALEMAMDEGKKQNRLKAAVKVGPAGVELDDVYRFRVDQRLEKLEAGDILLLVGDGVSKAFPGRGQILELVKEAIREGKEDKLGHYIVERAYKKIKGLVRQGARIDAITAAAIVW